MQALTERQQLVLNFIRQSVRERGYPPSLREIGAHMKIKSTNGVNDHLTALERKGYLRRDSMKSRALHLVEPAELEAPVDPQQHAREQLARRRSALVQQRSLVTQEIEAIDAELEVRNAS